jgi:lambda family phage portal protein
MRFRQWITGLFGRSNQFDAAGGGNRLANWKATPAGVNTWQSNPALLAARAQDADRNNPAARRAVDAICNACVGAAGINPHTRIEAVKLAWRAWAEDCNADGRAGWTETLLSILRTVIVSGEAFIVVTLDADKARRGLNPIRIQVLGPEHLDNSRIGPNTFEGVVFDGSKRIAYWFFEHAPTPHTIGLRSRLVSAENVFHVFKPLHPGAQRGASWLAPVLLVLRELQEYLDACLVKAKTAALFVGVVSTQDGSNPLQRSNETPTMEPGSMLRLQNGESVEFSNPPQDSTMLDPFIRWCYRRIAAGLNIPYELLTGDYSQVTFASGRGAKIDFQAFIEHVQYNILVAHFCAPFFRRWAELGAALGLIPGDVETPRWIGPRVEMLDPRSETAARIAAVRAGFTSRAEIVSQTGESVEDIDREIAADNARADALGLVLDADPRKVTQQGMQQMSEVQAAQ